MLASGVSASNPLEIQSLPFRCEAGDRKNRFSPFTHPTTRCDHTSGSEAFFAVQALQAWESLISSRHVVGLFPSPRVPRSTCIIFTTIRCLTRKLSWAWGSTQSELTVSAFCFSLLLARPIPYPQSWDTHPLHAGALKATNNRGLQPAMDHILENEANPVPDLSSVSSTPGSTRPPQGGGDPMDEDEDLEALRAVYGEGGSNTGQAEAGAKVCVEV